jgi:hypothetical protein
MRRGECVCGQLSVTCMGDPLCVSVCHCLDCKRRTGSAFSWNARWTNDAVAVEGQASTFTRIGDEGGRCVTSFCPRCGTTVYYRLEAQPDLIAIAAGVFADPAFAAPEHSSYDPSRRCGWVDIAVEDLDRLD